VTTVVSSVEVLSESTTVILTTHVRNFKMTCYYVAPILPAQFSSEKAAEADIADNAEFENVSIR
jgi:hypothetical protein